MRYLIDTNWVAEYLKGRERAVNLLTDLFPDGLAISIITYGEIYEGIYFGTNQKRHEQGFRLFLRGVGVLTLNRSIMKRFARIRGELRSKGQLISDPDILIASTALKYNLIMATNNVREFIRVSGLQLHQT